MKKILLVILMAVLMATSPVHAKVTVFTCEPEWGALAKEIGGDKVEIKIATSAFQDPHHLSAKPSLIAKMRKADLVICSGSSLEIGWLPVLLSKAGHPDVQPGQVGNLMASEYVKRIGERDHVDRSMGDVHPEGNPHVHLNPYNISKIAKELTNRLTKIDNENTGFYKQKHTSFDKKWKTSINKWEQRAAKLKNMPVVEHHHAWEYLVDWLKLKIVASLEPKPGIPPSISHLESVLAKVKQTPIKAIIRTPYESDNASKWLEEKTGKPALVLPYTVGGTNKAGDLQGLFDHTIEMLENATR